MTKKRKISYRDLAAGQQPPDAAPEGPPATAAPDVTPPPKPARRRRRTSSPVEIAATLREEGRAALAGGAVASEEPEDRPAPHAAPATAPPSQDVETYATILRRRLDATAPVVPDEDEAARFDLRPLRERVRERQGTAELLMFRIGLELFATDLSSVEEAVELPEIHRLPEMPVSMLGAFDLRGRLTPVYSPAHVIGVPLRGAGSAALLVRANGHRLGLAVDEVEDVLLVDLADVQQAPGTDDADGILLGVAHHGRELVAVIDAEALVGACVTGNAMENA